MNLEIASMTRVHPHPNRAIRADSGTCALPGPPCGVWASLAVVGLALLFVAAGASGLDLGPQEARTGLAAGERAGPMGQVLGYWAPDLWPAQVLPSLALTRLTASGRPTTGVVRWPAAPASIFAGWLLVWGMSRTFGARAAIVLGFCWFSSLAVIDRSAGAGIDPILGLATIGAIDRILTRGSDWIAGLWASLAFLAGGWPPLVVIALAILVIGRRGSRFSLRLLLPTLGTAIAWSATTIGVTSVEFWRRGDHAANDSAAGLDARIGRHLLLGDAVEPVRVPGLEPIDPRYLADGGPGVGHRLAPGRTRQPHRRIPGTGPWPVGTNDRPGRLARRRIGLPRIGLAKCPRARRTACVLLAVLGRPDPLAHRDDLRVLHLDPDHALLSHPRRRLGPHDPGRRRPGMVRPSAQGIPDGAWSPSWSSGIGLKLAHWGYYVPEWNYRNSQGPWGSRDRPVDTPEMVALHIPRLARRSLILHRPARPTVTKPSLLELPARFREPIRPAANPGVRELAGSRPSHLRGRPVP